ncbi:MAG: hypothetical protein WBZ36_14420 [Candidatus Nitrosopolaris sp.]
MTKTLVKVDGIWRLFSGNERRHLCDVCNHMSYTWKAFDEHKKTHTFTEHDSALWQAVDAKMQWDLLRDCPA